MISEISISYDAFSVFSPGCCKNVRCQSRMRCPCIRMAARDGEGPVNAGEPGPWWSDGEKEEPASVGCRCSLSLV